MKNQHNKNLIFLLLATLFGSTSGPLKRFIDLPPPSLFGVVVLLVASFYLAFVILKKSI